MTESILELNIAKPPNQAHNSVSMSIMIYKNSLNLLMMQYEFATNAVIDSFPFSPHLCCFCCRMIALELLYHLKQSVNRSYDIRVSSKIFSGVLHLSSIVR